MSNLSPFKQTGHMAPMSMAEMAQRCFACLKKGTLDLHRCLRPSAIFGTCSTLDTKIRPKRGNQPPHGPGRALVPEEAGPSEPQMMRTTASGEQPFFSATSGSALSLGKGVPRTGDEMPYTGENNCLRRRVESGDCKMVDQVGKYASVFSK